MCACHDSLTAPCGCQTTCDECASVYQDCGCLNPTIFDCLSKPPVLQYIPVSSDMNGTEVLKSIDDVIGGIQQSIQDIIVPTQNTTDVRVKTSATDTTSGFLISKIVKGTHIDIAQMAVGANEFLRMSVTPKTLVSPKAGNMLAVGIDNLLYVNTEATQTYLREGNGISISGSNTLSDPYVISASGFIQSARSCFDGVWRDFINANISVAGVIFVSSNAKYRIRYDGSVEFKGNATYTVTFSDYNGSTSKYSVLAGGIGSSCITLPEQNGVYSLKGISFIDTPQPSSDQITQSYGYVIRKSSKDIFLDFQSSFSSNTTKTVVVSFDGAIFHPTL